LIIEKLITIDIGHKNYSLDQALVELEVKVSECIFNSNVKAVKIVTGHGTGALKNAVREWCAQQEGRFREVIPGEGFDIFNPLVVNLREDCDFPFDKDLGANNKAVTYIWFW
tara:strand:+ start:2608 stop:2943 length:336 start_codon:yes stop_codon:yes gene_type:complete